MRFQDQVVRQTQKALDDICRAALAVPEDKRDWSPGGFGRSALSQMQEVAISATWLRPILAGQGVPADDDPVLAQRTLNDSIEKCVEAARASTSEICMAIAAFPDGRLEEEMTMPFGGGIVMTFAEVLGLHHWNMVYHLGQINQIQLMLGDKVMH
ncbi:MAG TPA: DinB family protein [Fimbriimonas sp.]|nr:DinB family protein [Fimbriimonas sp.]